MMFGRLATIGRLMLWAGINLLGLGWHKLEFRHVWTLRINKNFKTMARQVINIGQYPNDGTGDKIRVAYQKINEMTEELYALAAGGLNRFRGAYDLSLEEYPSTGGNGVDGIPAEGDY